MTTENIPAPTVRGYLTLERHIWEQLPTGLPPIIHDAARLQRAFVLASRVVRRLIEGRQWAADLPLIAVVTQPSRAFAEKVLAAPPFGEGDFRFGPWEGTTAIECAARMIRDLSELSVAACERHGLDPDHWDRLSTADQRLCVAAHGFFEHLREQTTDPITIEAQGRRVETAFKAWLSREAGMADFRGDIAFPPRPSAVAYDAPIPFWDRATVIERGKKAGFALVIDGNEYELRGAHQAEAARNLLKVKGGALTHSEICNAKRVDEVLKSLPEPFQSHIVYPGKGGLGTRLRP